MVFIYYIKLIIFTIFILFFSPYGPCFLTSLATPSLIVLRDLVCLVDDDDGCGVDIDDDNDGDDDDDDLKYLDGAGAGALNDDDNDAATDDDGDNVDGDI